jgi:2-beta-glucuronyltransferase
MYKRDFKSFWIMRIVFLTVHHASSERRVDFHFWADVLASRDIAIDFVTIGFSPATLLKKAGRRYPRPYNRWIRIDSNMRKFLWCPWFHPFGLPNEKLNKLVWHIYSSYPALLPKTLLNEISGADLFIIENGAGLMLIPRLASEFPQAKFIYNVCDRIETLGYHPIILKAEKEALQYFELIRVPAAADD